MEKTQVLLLQKNGQALFLDSQPIKSRGLVFSSFYTKLALKKLKIELSVKSEMVTFITFPFPSYLHTKVIKQCSGFILIILKFFFSLYIFIG